MAGSRASKCSVCLLGQALHLVRDVASPGPLGWKAALQVE